MASGQFFLGVGLLLLTVAPLAAAAHVVCRRFLPTLSGTTAFVAETVATLGAFTVVTQSLGLVGTLSRGPVVVTCAFTGISALVVARSTLVKAPSASASPSAMETERARHPVEVAVALVAGAVVAVQWLAVSLSSLRNGMNRSIDTLWYHGPASARFAQEGSIRALHYFDNPIFAFYPSHSELWHATGIVLFGDDVLSPLLNLVFLALALAAAWSIGDRFGAGPVSLLGALVVIGTPGFLGQSGSGYNDIVVVALILAAVALLLHRERQRGVLVLAAAAAGLAIGTKFSAVAIVGLLTLTVTAMAGRGRRLRTGATWLAVLLVTGGVWYMRNLAAAGSPVPVLDLSLGPLSLPSVPSGFTDYIARYLTTWPTVREVFIPGLDKTLGAGWWATLVIAVGGGVLVAAWGRPHLVRLLGAVAAVAFALYLLTPINLGLPRLPIYFEPSVRYAVPSLAVGMALLPALPLLQRGTGRRLLMIVLAVMFLVVQLDWRALWVKSSADEVTALLLVGASGIAAAVARSGRGDCCRGSHSRAWWSSPGRSIWSNGTISRIAGPRGSAASKPSRCSRSCATRRIATDGFVFQYPLHGRDLSNHVQILGELRRRGEYAADDIVPIVEAGDQSRSVRLSARRQPHLPSRRVRRPPGCSAPTRVGSLRAPSADHRARWNRGRRVRGHRTPRREGVPLIAIAVAPGPSSGRS